MMRIVMRQNTRLLIGATISLLVLALAVSLNGRGDSDEAEPAPATSTRSTTTAAPTTTQAPTTTAATTTTQSPVELRRIQLSSLVASLRAEELAAQLIVIGINGTDPQTRLINVVGTACVGGIFITESNNNWAPIDSRDAARRFVDEIDTAAAGLCDPPLITTDAEFGSVVRVPINSHDATSVWTERFVTGTAFDVLIGLQKASFDLATGLRDLGVDINFGAVADVDTDPGNFMARSGRTFGDDPAIVATLSASFVKGHCEAGVAATLKHFPNQGDTRQDPHRESSIASSNLDTWRETGRVPYANADAPVIMTGHILTDVDPDLPASMSHAVTTGLLRDELGYEGVVITDDLSTMRGAIDVIGNAGERAIAAITAGADLALFVNDNDAATVISALTERISSDDSFGARAREAALRTHLLRAALAEPELFPLCS
ncbi:MAG: beta-N-acetylhexosaminidase [Candidatus Aldehydirespiratoraceae bacterium]|jgi:beta-N-acetylhexosaminidase